MITVFNSQNYAQQWFFDKAFAILKAKGLLNEQELKYERFLSLEGYFAHMADLIATDVSYVLIPTDEEPFVIDANARTISIPAAFNKCAGVVGDDMCEIITFTIDRYFDYVDLANVKICIQWEAHGKEGISHINLIDLETIPGKIRFGWPLTKELTAAPGPVKFAVRFFEKKEDKFIYLLNTLSTTLTIKDGLNIVNPEVTENAIHSLFGKFVQNTINPTYPTPAPVLFDDNVGKDLPSRNKIDENDQMEFIAQAVTSDKGHIKYQWYFKEGATPDQTEARYVPATGWSAEEKYYTYDVIDKTYVRAYPMSEEEYNKGTFFTYEELYGVPVAKGDSRFKVEEIYEKIATPEKRNGAEQYFEEIETGVFKLVTSKELPRDKQLYERFTKLTIVPSKLVSDESDPKAITGLYWVGASNYVGNDQYEIDNVNYPEAGRIYAMNHTPEINSIYSYVGAPENVIITKDLVQDIFMEEIAEGSYKAELQLELQEDKGEPKRTFNWYRNDEDNSVKRNEDGAFENDLLSDISGIEKNKVNITQAGWHYAHINSELNRATSETISSVCRVLEPAKAPTLLKMEYAMWKDVGEMDPVLYFANPDNWHEVDPENVMESGVAKLGDVVRLRISTDMDNEGLNGTGLKTDSLVYSWYVIEPDMDINAEDPGRILDSADIDKNGFLHPDDKYLKNMHSREIDVQCTDDDIKTFFYCKVENTIAGVKKTLDHNSYGETLFQVW